MYRITDFIKWALTHSEPATIPSGGGTAKGKITEIDRPYMVDEVDILNNCTVIVGWEVTR